MKRIVATILVILACFLQLAFSAHAQILVPAVNLVFVAVVLASCFLDGSESLWLALLGGLILDFYSLSEFGVNVAFLVVVALITKLILNLGRSNSRLSYSIIIVALGTIFYNLLLIVNLLVRDDIISYLLLSRQISLEVIVNLASFLVFYAGISFITGRGGAQSSKLTFAPKKR